MFQDGEGLRQIRLINHNYSTLAVSGYFNFIAQFWYFMNLDQTIIVR